MLFHDSRVRELMNMKIFVDTGFLYAFYLMIFLRRFYLLEIIICCTFLVVYWLVLFSTLKCVSRIVLNDLTWLWVFEFWLNFF